MWKATVDLLRSLGHEVVTASEIGLSKASDEEILKKGCGRRASIGHKG